jgi:divalent metal cation (Fe/Co/Zn/Cd) transporter
VTRQEPNTSESMFTVLVALAANAGIGVAKLFAGLLSGSSALLSEAAHSAGDTCTELLLITALRARSSTIAEASRRAMMFLGAVSGGFTGLR